MTPTPHAPRMPLATLAGLGLAMLVLAAMGPAIAHGGGYAPFVALLVTAGCAVYFARGLAGQVPERSALLVILGLAVCMRLVVMLQEPFLSTDIFRYVWDGRVQGAGINPYRFVPADPALSSLRDAAIFPNINRADYAVTAYPPVAQMFFLAVAWISDSLLAMRLAMLGCEALLVVLLMGILRRIGRPATDIVVWAWHPLAIWEIAHSGHVEAFMAALLILGLTFLLRGNRVLGAVAVALATLVKPYALVVLPVFWRRWDWRVPVAVAVAVALCYLPYLGVGRGVLGFLTGGYLAEEGLATGHGFWIVGLVQALIGPVPGLVALYLCIVTMALGALALYVVANPTSDAQETIDRFGLLLMAGLLLISPNYPWYFLSLVPFVAIGSRSLSLSAAALTIAAPLLYRPLILPHHDLAWKTLAMLPLLAVLGRLLAARRKTRELSGVPQWTK